MMTDIDYDAIQERVDSFLNKEKEIDNLKSTITELEDEFEDLYYQMIEAVNENETLKKELTYHQQIAKNHKIDLDHANENLKYVESAKAGVIQQLEELEKTHADLDEKYGYLEIANEKLERKYSWLNMVHASFKKSVLEEIQGLEATIEDLKRTIADMKIVNDRLLQSSTSTYDAYWSNQTHRCQEEMEYWKAKAEEIGRMYDEEEDTSEYWHNVADDFEQEIEELKNMLSDSDDQNESLLSIRQEERVKEREKELMGIIDHQFNELANFKDRVDEQDQIIKEEKRNTQFWYEKATDCGGSLNRYQSEIDSLNKELNEYSERVKELESLLEANEDNAQFWYETAENLRVENDNLVTRSDINVLEAKQGAYRQGITDAYNGIVNWMKNDIRWDGK